MKRVSLWLAMAALGALALAGQAFSSGSRSTLSPMTLLRRADASMSATRNLHQLMGRTRPTRFYRIDAKHPDTTYAVWAGRLHTARKAVKRPPHRSAWECIHRYEGPWDDTGAPYYGGLQMDWSFMRAYGGWLLSRRGTADRWTPLQQMWVAENALRAGRGFYPWPNTARMCGLI